MKVLLSILLGAGCTVGGKVPEVCGDGVWSPLEDCDPAEPTYGAWCLDDCTWNTCGDGVVGPDETCDPPDGETCSTSCRPVGCDNGVVDEDELCLAPHAELSVGIGAADVAVGDVDGDGDLDLLVARPDTSTVLVWFNDAGRFERSAEVEVGLGALVVGVADGDIVAAGTHGVTLRRWRGTHHRTDTLPWPEPTTPVADSLATTLHRGDPTASIGTAAGPMQIVWDDASTTPPGVMNFAPEGSRLGIVVDPETADVDYWMVHPTEPVLVARYGANAITVDLPGIPWALRSAPSGVLALDVDAAWYVARDRSLTTFSTPDLIDAAAGSEGGHMFVIHADAQGIARGSTRGPVVAGIADVELADLDGDGFLDVVALRPDAGMVHVWMRSP